MYKCERRKLTLTDIEYLQDGNIIYPRNRYVPLSCWPSHAAVHGLRRGSLSLEDTVEKIDCYVSYRGKTSDTEEILTLVSDVKMHRLRNVQA